jgi:hypothetical protein
MKRTKLSKIGLVFGAALFGVLTGCVTHDHRPQQGTLYAPPAPGYVVVEDDYVYYPGYQVYYSRNRRQYVYLEGRSWVARPAPPRVSVEVLVASPSVRLDFHDAPSTHHSKVVQQYPKHWAPPGKSPNHGKGNGKDGKDNEPRGPGK